jgi:hypothetical protein
MREDAIAMDNKKKCWEIVFRSIDERNSGSVLPCGK